MDNRIDVAVKYICPDIEKSIAKKRVKTLTEQELIEELILAILGSRTNYEIALLATEEIIKSQILIDPLKKFTKLGFEKAIILILHRPLFKKEWGIKGKHYRFPNSRARYVSDTIWNIYNKYKTLTAFLSQYSELSLIRKALIAEVKGFGPKQASHFLRNIGFTENIAVLDVHILQYMYIKGLIARSIKTVSDLHLYEKLEAILLEALRAFKFSVSCVDQAIWIVMRVYKSGEVA